MLISLADWARKNGMAGSTARQKALRGGFKTAVKVGRDWLIDEDEERIDLRYKENKKEEA